MLRIIEFHPVEDRIVVNTYSPFLNSYENDVDSQFSLDYYRKELIIPSPTPNYSSIPTPIQTPLQTLKPTPASQLAPSSTSTPKATHTNPPQENFLIFFALAVAVALSIEVILLFIPKKNNKKISSLPTNQQTSS